MKTVIYLALLFASLSNYANAKSTLCTTTINQKDSVELIELGEIQSKIQQAYSDSFADQNNSKLVQIATKLQQGYTETQNPLYIYWKAYAQYHESITYLGESKRDEAKETINQAIESLDAIKSKNSEDYALLSMLQNFSCQFAGYPAVIEVSKKSSKNIAKAIELDDTNMRAYYVFASIDFYTPKGFGGGKKVEEYLLKALSLPIQNDTNTSNPSWGRQEVYEMLSNFYLKNGNADKAKEYTQKGLKEFPNSNTLNQNATK